VPASGFVPPVPGTWSPMTTGEGYDYYPSLELVTQLAEDKDGMEATWV
jgi:hypothetical protein